jgi:cytochrome P450
MARNVTHLKNVLREIVEERKSGKTHVYGSGQTDLLNILLTDEFYGSHESVLIDELITFFVAGMKTV